MHDAFLGHRLGLIPIKAPADKFDYVIEEENKQNMIQFELNIQCPSTSTSNLKVYSKDLQWIPIGDQVETFKCNPIRPVEEDILICKLAPSQTIEATLHCHKGIGKDHAKYCPVSACFYRYLTEFDFITNETLTEEEIEHLKICFPKGYLDFSGGYPRILNHRLETSDLTFASCPSLNSKISMKTHQDIITCK